MREYEFPSIRALCSLGSAHTQSLPPSLLHFSCKFCTTKCSCFIAQGYILEVVGEISPPGLKAHIMRLPCYKGKEGQQYLEIRNRAEEELKVMANGSVRPEKEWGNWNKVQMALSCECQESLWNSTTANIQLPLPSLPAFYSFLLLLTFKCM